MLTSRLSRIKFVAGNSYIGNEAYLTAGTAATLARKLNSILVVGALMFVSGTTPALARTREEARAVLAAKIKDGVARLGTGQEAEVRLILSDKSVLAGFIGQTDEQQFVLVSPEIELRRTLAYGQIEQLHGENFATGLRISVGEGQKPLKNFIRLLRTRIPGSGRPVETTSKEFLSKPFIVVVVVLAVGLIVVGVELGKS